VIALICGVEIELVTVSQQQGEGSRGKQRRGEERRGSQLTVVEIS
jgi:hypothetical protein